MKLYLCSGMLKSFDDDAKGGNYYARVHTGTGSDGRKVYKYFNSKEEYDQYVARKRQKAETRPRRVDKEELERAEKSLSLILKV